MVERDGSAETFFLVTTSSLEAISKTESGCVVWLVEPSTPHDVTLPEITCRHLFDQEKEFHSSNVYVPVHQLD
jgi:hypothetical protein